MLTVNQALIASNGVLSPGHAMVYYILDAQLGFQPHRLNYKNCFFGLSAFPTKNTAFLNLYCNNYNQG
jgi:hypothetical protein